MVLAYMMLDRPEDAEPLFAKIVNSARAWTMLSDPNVCATIENYVTLLRMKGRNTEADKLDARLKAALKETEKKK
jgi:hypothetical protein